ncbi:hypothetical protein ACX80E_06375 [Arthrobacter sp. TMN-49]
MKNAVYFLIAIALFVGGFLLFGAATAGPQWRDLIFAGGLISVTLAFVLPFVVFPRMDP